MDIKPITNELSEVLSYMTDALIREFPTTKATPEHFIVSVLDKKNCNAYVLLSSFMRAQNLEDIKNVFITHIKDNLNPIIPTPKPEDIQATEELEAMMNESDFERILMGNPVIGSQHVILAMINPKNNHSKMIDVFKNIGVDYNFVNTKCMEVTKKTNETAKRNLKNLTAPINKNEMANNKPNPIELFTIDITKEAENGCYDDFVGREKEMMNIIEILSRRKKNNVVILGKSGVGKTSIVYGLANAIVHDNVPYLLRNKRIVQLNVASMIAGTYLRGAFEERVKMLFDALKASDKYILFIDDIHTVLKSTTKDRDSDMSSMLTEILSNGEVKVIGTTSFKDYRNSIESNTMISRRFQKVVLEPSTKEDTIKIINNNKEYYESYHNVKYLDDAIEKCVTLAERYITDRCLPDSAIDILDLCGAKANTKDKNQDIEQLKNKLVEIDKEREELVKHGKFDDIVQLLGKKNDIQEQISNIERDLSNNKTKYTKTITANDVFETVSDITNIPINKLNIDEKKKLATIDKVLKECVIGQDDAIDKICKAIKRNKVGIGNKNKPIASMLLVGKSGVGKTLVAKKLAEEIFGDVNALIRIDMSEYSEKHSVSKLTGAAPGYIGYDNGGQLTEAVKHKQYCVILLDEIEKADQEVYNLFLQLLDEGRLTDNSGYVVDFKNTIILMTSNVGTKEAQEFGSGMGFVSNDASNTEAIITKEIKKKFSPEFINRLDNIVYFNNLTYDNLKEVCKLELAKMIARIGEIGYNIVYEPNIIPFIVDKCKVQMEYGARPLLRFIQDNIEDLVTNEILSNDFNVGHTFNLSIVDDKITVLSYSSIIAN